ncbi:MAG: hypothetical protein A3C36_04325 [Omnitrophica WOR_2 bacterium RIFCSPHIGHO2_02_FULL_52_10]|nr:MAG: hypothetical protein A3C36_04325 [Omnitrophica WOR_2 bacterium RIFCSPHIGHO2_02_FULL_52_10]
MFKAMREIFNYRDLLFMLTTRDLRVRYKQAAMGFLWAVFMPIIAVCAGILIKKAMAVVAQRPLEIDAIVSITVKTLPYTFFISSIRFAVQALVGNSSLVTKIYFPRAVLVLSSIFACMFDFCVAAAVVVILLTVFKVGVSIYLLWAPFLLLLLVLFTFGLGLILSSANLFFRDVKYVVEIILMFGIFFTPVFFSASDFGKWEPLMLINPIGSILETLNRVVVLHQMPDLFWLSYATLATAAIFTLGMTVFHKMEPLFAENI